MFCKVYYYLFYVNHLIFLYIEYDQIMQDIQVQKLCITCMVCVSIQIDDFSRLDILKLT